jgi:hypothetical protein
MQVSAQQDGSAGDAAAQVDLAKAICLKQAHRLQQQQQKQQIGFNSAMQFDGKQ